MTPDPELGVAPANGREAKPNPSTAKQIKALVKKNMKIHMRTNAMPCCSCSLVNACLLHFCCPIFFVMASTLVPWIIVKSVGTAEDQRAFLQVQVERPKVFRLWPEWLDHELNTEPEWVDPELNTEQAMRYRPPPSYSLWAPRPWRVWTDGQCGAEVRGCFCKTLALVGPDTSVSALKTLLQREADQFWADFEANRAAVGAALNTTRTEIMQRVGLSWEYEEEYEEEEDEEDRRRRRLEGLPAGAPGTSSISRRLDALRAQLREAASSLPGSLADFAADATLARRLQRGRPDSGEREACMVDESPVPESMYCDVDAGHSGTIFRTFPSTEALEDFVLASEYGRYARDRSETSDWDRLCGAIILENDVLSAAEPAYTIRLNTTHQMDDLPITELSTEPVQREDHAVRWYASTGFLYLQHLLHTLLAESRAGPAPGGRDVLRGEPHAVPAPTLEGREWVFGMVVGGILGNPMVNSLMFGPMVASIAFYMSRERSTRQRELMRMMGLSDSALLWSWVLMFVAFNLIITFVMTIFFLAFFFINTDFFLVWMVLFWFSNASLAFGMAVTAFVTSERTAAMASLGLFFSLTFLMTSVSKSTPMGIKALVSLLPPDGFLLTMTTIWNWELTGMGGTFSTSNSSIQNYSIALGIWLLFVDFWLYLLIYYYVDSIAWWHNAGVARKPYFCFTGSYWREVMGKPPVVDAGGKPDLESSPNPKYVESEDDVHLKQLVQSDKCVIIRRLFKSFTDAAGAKVHAVKDLSLTMYQDECFCLLGHNGAGKTTTMLMLTGCLPQSSGQIKVKGCSIPEQVRAIRTSMGFCPQHNVLFNELTVFEHLDLFGALGGMAPGYIAQRGAELVAAVALSDKMHTRASALSGGMKRKLSAALAFLAEPYLVILDEPSSGMDPFARRGMWNTLKQWRTGHILCLTTHYMDEADALGDRIAIMSSGQLACSGSSTFLKRQFGCGYVLSFAKASDSADYNAKILQAVRSVLGPEAEVMSTAGKELLLQVPFRAAERFPTLFPQLDSNREELGIESYGTSVANLEEVFLKVARMEKEEKKGTAAEGQRAEHAPQGSIKQASFLLQLSAMLLRRFKFGYRNRMTCACQIGLPMMCLLLFCLISTGAMVFTFSPLVLDASRWNLEVEGVRSPVTVGTMQSSPEAFRSEVRAMWSDAPGVDAVSFASVAPATYPNPFPNSSAPAPVAGVALGVAEESGFARAVLANADLHAASQYGGAFYPETSSWCPAAHATACPAVGVTIVANLTAPHSAPALFNAHAAAALRRRSAGVANIVVTNHPFPKVETQRSREERISDILAAMIIMAAYGFIPSGVTSYVVMEKEKDVKNQLIISGCSYSAYWCSNFIFDVFWGLIPAIGAWIIFFIFDFGAFTKAPGFAASVALFLTYLPAMAGFAYLFSFLFSKSGVALFASWAFNLCFGMLALILMSILRSIPDAYDVMAFMRWLFRFVPVFSLGHGHLLIGIFQRRAAEVGVGALAGVGVGGAECRDASTVLGAYRRDAHCVYMVGDEFLFQVLTGILYIALTISADTLCGLPCFKRLFGAQPRLPQKAADSGEDSLVLEEKERVQKVDRASQFVFVQGAHKVYRNGFHAVRGISFAASEGQVFGLLGVNGAGKTTTFKMLCGQVEPTAGDISIQGFDVTTQAAQARRLIGYCPQFDALLDSLTSQEHLYLYGRLKGLTSGELSAAVAQQLHDLDLESYVQSRAGQLSGGNKRKLSVAMATIGEPPMVFLDEPSAGMDPVARRGMWSVIQNIAEKRRRSVVILTTHSMEEAEALCSRIAIQVDGRFRCLGTPQQIKSRYGRGLELNVRLATPTQQEILDCCAKFEGSPSQLIAASAAAGKVETVFGRAALEEVAGRPGSPLAAEAGAVPMALLAEWALLAVRTKALEAFFIKEIKPEANGAPAIMSMEKAQNVLRYQVLAAALQGRFKSLGALFSLLQEHKEELAMEDFQVCQTSLEQVFNSFATSQASQAGAAAPPPPPAPAETKADEQPTTVVKADVREATPPATPPGTVEPA